MELKCERLSRQFRDKKAVDQVSFAIANGVHALLGANGSGKTTLIRMLVGLLPPSEGAIYFDGVSIQKQYDSYCAALGYMPQRFGFYPNYSVEEFLSYMGLLKRLPKPVLNERIDELLRMLSLMDVRRRKMKHLSGGMLRRSITVLLTYLSLYVLYLFLFLNQQILFAWLTSIPSWLLLLVPVLYIWIILRRGRQPYHSQNESNALWD